MQDAVLSALCRWSVLPRAGHVNNSRPLIRQRPVTLAEHSLTFFFPSMVFVKRGISGTRLGSFWIVSCGLFAVSSASFRGLLSSENTVPTLPEDGGAGSGAEALHRNPCQVEMDLICTITRKPHFTQLNMSPGYHERYVPRPGWTNPLSRS
jgi:hypothetical protein